MTTKTESRDLYDADGRNIWTYCETCYEAPQTITVELTTTSAKDIEPATSITAFVVTCSDCHRTTRFVPGS